MDRSFLLKVIFLMGAAGLWATGAEAATALDAYGGSTALSCTWPHSATDANSTPADQTFWAPISSITASGSSTVTVVASTPINLWVGENIFVTGTTHFNATSAPSQLQVASITDSEHFTYTNKLGTTYNATDSAGTIIAARWYYQQLTDSQGNQRWFECTPLGHAKFTLGLYPNSYTGTNVDWNGASNQAILQVKYATDHSGCVTASQYEDSWSINTLNRLISWGWNSLSDLQGNSGLESYWAPMGSDTDYSTACNHAATGDQSVPDSVKLPTWDNWLNFWAVYDAKTGQPSHTPGNYINQGVKSFSNLIKQNTSGGWTAFDTYAQSVDAFDSRHISYMETALTTDSRWTQFYSSNHNDYFQHFDADETDTTGFFKAGPDFPTVSAGVLETNNSQQTEHPGWAVLISAPVETGSLYSISVHSQDSSSFATNWVYANDSANHTKTELANWLQGLTDQTTGVSAARLGTTVTYTSAGHPYTPYELITVAGCSDSSFNSTSGIGLTVASTTAGAFVVTGFSGSGSAGTGCTVTTGPGYLSIAALNTAWSSHYDTFGSDAASQTNNISTSCAGQSSCSVTLSPVNLTPMSLYITDNATNIQGDDGRGVICLGGCGTAGQGDIVDSSGETTRGTITYSTGALNITSFATAPGGGDTVTAVYSTNGWGAGYGLLDEDGTCPAKSNGGSFSCWMPATTGQTCANGVTAGSGAFCTNLSGIPGGSTMATDLGNFGFHYAKKWIKNERTAIAYAAPGVTLMCLDEVGGWSSPPFSFVLQAWQPFCDVVGFKEIPIGPDPNGLGTNGTTGNQPRADFIAKYLGDLPWEDFTDDFFAHLDSSLANFPTAYYDYANQPARAQGYYNAASSALGLSVSSNCACSFVGTYPMTEIGWYLQNDVWGSTPLNFGLISWEDNPYDGVSAGTVNGTDAWGYPTGCPGNFGYTNTQAHQLKAINGTSLSPGQNTLSASNFCDSTASPGCTSGGLSSWAGGAPPAKFVLQDEVVIINKGLGDEEDLPAASSTACQGGQLGVGSFIESRII